jgi:competence protein ComEC
LPGEDPDIESVVAPLVGEVEVYHVNHHGSRFSSTDAWLDAIDAEVAIISVGGNSYGHPHADVLQRLHEHTISTFWTNIGSGATPDEDWDTVGGTIEVWVRPGGYVVATTGS